MNDMVGLVTRLKYCEGEQVFELDPLWFNHRTMSKQLPALPMGGGTFFYSPSRKRVVVAATKTAASYLRKRSYAKYLGVAVYSSRGCDHFTLHETHSAEENAILAEEVQS